MSGKARLDELLPGKRWGRETARNKASLTERGWVAAAHGRQGGFEVQFGHDRGQDDEAACGVDQSDGRRELIGTRLSKEEVPALSITDNGDTLQSSQVLFDHSIVI